MRYKLMFSNKGWWKQIDASNDYDKLLNKAMELDDNIEWMIVDFKRYHSGVEQMELGSDDVGGEI